MNTKTRNRMIAVIALLAAGGGLAFIAFGNMGENLVYYWTPKELIEQGNRAHGPTIRLGGMVKPGSVEWSAQHTSVKFRVAEGLAPEAPSVMVTSEQTPPQMFREGIGVVVEGTFGKDQVFHTHRLMVNHSNEYRAPKEGDHSKSWKQTVSEADPAGAK